MDRYLFRGLRTDGEGFVYGSYTKHPQYNSGEITQYYKTDFEDHYLTLQYAVIPETVGQWTGLRDKWEQMIFEGDLVVIYECKIAHRVEYIEGCYYIIDTYDETDKIQLRIYCEDEIEVIGNIHQEVNNENIN